MKVIKCVRVARDCRRFKVNFALPYLIPGTPLRVCFLTVVYIWVEGHKSTFGILFCKRFFQVVFPCKLLTKMVAKQQDGHMPSESKIVVRIIAFAFQKFALNVICMRYAAML